MERLRQEFVDEFWKRFNDCQSEEDYANLIAWIYFETEDTYVDVPFLEVIAQIWTVSPSTILKYIEFSGPSMIGLILSAIRDEIGHMTKDELVELKQKIIPTSIIYLNKKGGQ